MEKVKSSNIDALLYDPSVRELYIKFKGNTGGVYRYTDVAQDTYNNMYKADSIGKYFFAHIKNKFKFIKIFINPNEIKSIGFPEPTKEKQ